MGRPKKLTILSHRFGGAFGLKESPEEPRAYCRYYKSKPHKVTLLCERCNDIELCAKNKSGEGIGQKKSSDFILSYVS